MACNCCPTEKFVGDEKKSGFWEQTDARLKLLLTLVLLVLAVGAPRLYAPAAVLLLALSVLLTQIPWRKLWPRLLPVAVIASFLFLTQLVWYGHTPLFKIGAGWLTITGYREGIGQGLLLALRVLGGYSLLSLLTATTQVKDLLAAARWLHVPLPMLEITASAYRQIHLLGEEAQTVYRAQRLRLGYNGWRRSLTNISQLGGIVLVRALDRCEVSERALQSRGCSLVWQGIAEERTFGTVNNYLVLGLGLVLLLFLWRLGY